MCATRWAPCKPPNTGNSVQSTAIRTHPALASAKPIERCSDGVEGNELQKCHGLYAERDVLLVMEAASRASGSPFNV
jgi:hypothetical protein